MKGPFPLRVDEASMTLATLGDSLSCGYMLGQSFITDPNASYPVIVGQAIGATSIAIAAVPGARIDAIIPTIASLPRDADVLIINAGTNDLWKIGYDYMAPYVIDRWCALYGAAAAHMPRARIVAVGLRDYTVQRDRECNELIREGLTALNAHALALPGVIPVDLASRPGAYAQREFPDSVHPSPFGVQWIADAVIEALGANV